MGVPAFFRWLSMKYPSIVSHCVEKRGAIIDDEGNRAPVDTTEPNPNGIEFDNLYLDMNGIIHPCTHPENKPAPKCEAEMFIAIFEYIDRLFAIIRPRRVLYMAIDGVAPRAKMNQQRSRRFRAAKETKEKLMTIEKLRYELAARGANLPPPKPESEHFDSNCITPGTPFMSRLAEALQYYIYDRLTNDKGWKNLIVFLSDANVPGEGEHKIMDFIRRQRNSPSHDPNTKHCLCGADADLIMLGLATHEPYFTIIREEFKPNQPKPCDLCGQLGHDMEDCVGVPRQEDDLDKPPPIPAAEQDFIFIHLNILRQYLAEDLKLPDIQFEWSLERVIDDWVFMCFFVGNDFLPHLPSLEIREGAIDRLVEIYKSAIKKSDSWLTDSGRVHMKYAQLILTELGKMEDEIFKTRRQSELDFRKRKQRNAHFGSRNGNSNFQRSYHQAPESGILKPVCLSRPDEISQFRQDCTNKSVTSGQVSAARRYAAVASQNSTTNWVDRNLNNLEAATALKVMLKPREPGAKDYPGRFSEPSESKSRKSDPNQTASQSLTSSSNPPADEDAVSDAADEVRLWEDGWRSRYYKSKFGVDPSDAPEFCIKVGREYARGLCWVLAYYYQGCASWDWYFPYHYAPFASDFVRIDDLDPGFADKPTKPFCPLEQLMGVFPADSRSHVPPAWQDLMTDPNSPIIDFYPTDFKVDLNGKRFLWMGVALLPFVDEVRLLKALDERRHLLTPEEVNRNIRGPDRIFLNADHGFAKSIKLLYSKTTTKPADEEPNDGESSTMTSNGDKIKIDSCLTFGVSGSVWPDLDHVHLPGTEIRSAVPSLLPAIPMSDAISACYADPEYPNGFVFPARLLENVKLPPPTTLRPPERGRGRGGRGRMGHNNFNRSTESHNQDNDQQSLEGRYDHRNGGNYSRQQYTPMERAVRHSLPASVFRGYGGPNRGRYDSSTAQPPPNPYQNRFPTDYGRSQGYYPPPPYQTHPSQYSTGQSRGGGGGGGGRGNQFDNYHRPMNYNNNNNRRPYRGRPY